MDRGTLEANFACNLALVALLVMSPICILERGGNHIQSKN